jgi:ribonuclease J
VHGEFRHQVRHAQLAEEMGVLGKNVFVLHVGDVLRIAPDKAQSGTLFPPGRFFVDGIALGEMEGSLLKERRELAEEEFSRSPWWWIGPFGSRPAPPWRARDASFPDARELYRQIEGRCSPRRRPRRRRRSALSRMSPRALGLACGGVMKGYARSAPVVVPLVTVLEE